MVEMGNQTGDVSSTVVVNNLTNGFDIPEGKSVSGQHIIVGIDIDTTGRRLIDEIVQLAAYSPKSHFEQYIMPYMNLNPAARQRHQVRVISIGFYRMLKSMHTYKIIKSKSEIAALKDFLDWLEQLKASDSSMEGIILVYHEERKFIPYMILESLKKYNLLDRFRRTVKSFANGYQLASNDGGVMQHMSLRKLSKVLTAKMNEHAAAAAAAAAVPIVEAITSSETPTGGSAAATCDDVQNEKICAGRHHSQDSELFDGNASVRAKLAYEVALKMSNKDMKVPIDSPAATEKLLNALRPFAKPISRDLNELQTQNQNLERQNSFRPVFLNYFKTTLYHRVRAVKFRIILAEQGYDLQTLCAIWGEKQKEGIDEVLNVIDELKMEDKSELSDLLDSFFDPNKQTIKPLIKNGNRRRSRRTDFRVRGETGGTGSRHTAEQGAGGDKQSSTTTNGPDSTVKSPSTTAANEVASNAKPPRPKRNQRSRQNSTKSQTPNETVESVIHLVNGGATVQPAAVAAN